MCFGRFFKSNKKKKAEKTKLQTDDNNPRYHICYHQDSENFIISISSTEFSTNHKNILHKLCLNNVTVKIKEYIYPAAVSHTYGMYLFSAVGINIIINIYDGIENKNDYKKLRDGLLSLEEFPFSEGVFNEFERKHNLQSINSQNSLVSDIVNPTESYKFRNN